VIIRRQTRNWEMRKRRIERFAENLPRDAHREFVRKTPVDTGNARRKTDLSNTEIQANYPYSVRLEKESWSRQAPRGMSEPTIDWIREQLRRL
jgi:hypothetical protein